MMSFVRPCKLSSEGSENNSRLTFKILQGDHLAAASPFLPFRPNLFGVRA